MPWKQGQSGNPAGRPRGSRDRLSEAFISDLADSWDQHGKSTLERIREDDPVSYARLALHVLPRDVKLAATIDITEIIKAAAERQALSRSEVVVTHDSTKLITNAIQPG